MLGGAGRAAPAPEEQALNKASVLDSNAPHCLSSCIAHCWPHGKRKQAPPGEAQQAKRRVCGSARRPIPRPTEPVAHHRHAALERRPTAHCKPCSSRSRYDGNGRHFGQGLPAGYAILQSQLGREMRKEGIRGAPSFGACCAVRWCALWLQQCTECINSSEVIDASGLAGSWCL